MVRESERLWSSLQILENSPELIVTREVYSVSGIERCSISRVIKLRANSVDLKVFGFSKVILRVLGSYSAWRVIESDGSANFKTFERFEMFMPRTRLVSHLYVSNPSMLRLRETRATCDVSIACRERPKFKRNIQ